MTEGAMPIAFASVNGGAVTSPLLGGGTILQTFHASP
jgi:hypothetical protein